MSGADMYPYRQALESAADPGYAAFMSKLIPGKEGIIGVRMPTVRSIAKRVIGDDWVSFLETVPSCYEEEMLHALVIATAPVTEADRIGLLDRFMPCIDNWAVCDSLCSAWHLGKGEGAGTWDFLVSQMGTGEEYRMRVSVVMRMAKFPDEEHVGLLLEDLMEYDNEGYYYRMGAAWAVSVCYVRCPGLTEDALSSGRFCDWTQNKAVQKIRESFRVSDADKERVLAFKRRAL